ncbi:hypothetical protein OF83DRAFT_1172596 [Amylostereum chailletii]|nr:hypothetical protein OF83DRAFT_1172596 [Amylostereum chailletii]
MPLDVDRRHGREPAAPAPAAARGHEPGEMGRARPQFAEGPTTRSGDQEYVPLGQFPTKRRKSGSGRELQQMLTEIIKKLTIVGVQMGVPKVLESGDRRISLSEEATETPAPGLGECKKIYAISHGIEAAAAATDANVAGAEATKLSWMFMNLSSWVFRADAPQHQRKEGIRVRVRGNGVANGKSLCVDVAFEDTRVIAGSAKKAPDLPQIDLPLCPAANWNDGYQGIREADDPQKDIAP